MSKNTTLKVLNVESNHLDPEALMLLAKALTASKGTSALEVWKFNNQRTFGSNFGAPFEEVAAELANKNTNITKLGFSAQGPHWRNTIDKAMLRNNDIARRRRKGRETIKDNSKTEEKPLKRLTLEKRPDNKPAYEVFDEKANDKLIICRKYMGEYKKIPAGPQLQTFANDHGKHVSFSQAVPLLTEFTTKLLGAFNGLTVEAIDNREVKVHGALREVIEQNKRWTIKIHPDASMRYEFKADKIPEVHVSDDVADWVRPEEKEDDRLKAYFRDADKDGDGVINKEEFALLMREDGEFSDDEVNTLFKKVDLDGDGVINFVEFGKWVQEGEG